MRHLVCTVSLASLVVGSPCQLVAGELTETIPVASAAFTFVRQVGFGLDLHVELPYKA